MYTHCMTRPLQSLILCENTVCVCGGVGGGGITNRCSHKQFGRMTFNSFQNMYNKHDRIVKKDVTIIIIVTNIFE